LLIGDFQSIIITLVTVFYKRSKVSTCPYECGGFFIVLLF